MRRLDGLSRSPKGPGSLAPLRHVDRPFPTKPMSLAFCLGVLTSQVQARQPFAASFAGAEQLRAAGPSQPGPNPNPAPAPVPAPTGAAHLTVGFSVKSGTTLLEVHDQRGVGFVVKVQRDASVSFKARPDKIEVVGELKGGSTVIVADSYPSASRGLHHCQAGHERFLRVLSPDGAHANRGRARSRPSIFVERLVYARTTAGPHVPAAGVGHDRVDVRVLRRPPQGLVGLTGIGDQRRRIARPTADLPYGNPAARGLLHGRDDLAHRVTGPRAQVQL